LKKGRARGRAAELQNFTGWVTMKYAKFIDLIPKKILEKPILRHS
jgi:hypothetical protein